MKKKKKQQKVKEDKENDEKWLMMYASPVSAKPASFRA